jgi:16S rRNA (cytosine967-C5)-methyltransferase
MTPAARLSAAIDILDEIADGRVADRVLKHWAKYNRYAGSKDRAAIQARVFDVLRNRSLYAHAMSGDSPRALLLGSLVAGDQISLDEISSLFDGGRFSPDVLNDEEVALLGTYAERVSAMSDHAKVNVPDWIVPELQEALGEKFLEEMTALNERAPVDIRVNLAKGDRDAARKALAEEGIETELMLMSPWGLRAEQPARVTHTQTFKDGFVEIQDEGSQLTCLIANAKPGEQIVDLCAGAGGKALSLAACLEGKGQVLACDIDARRLGRLKPRARRAKTEVIQTRPLHGFDPNVPDPDLGNMEGQADCVVVDAPCTGSGAWRRHPESRWHLTPEKLATYQATQAEVLLRGARLVRPGGRLVYVTCSMLRSENDDQIDAFLENFPEFKERDWRDNWPEGAMKPNAPSGSRLRLSPATTNTDGFFACILERTN